MDVQNSASRGRTVPAWPTTGFAPAAESLWSLPSKTIGEDTKEEATVDGKK